jgi:hypothetical protein
MAERILRGKSDEVTSASPIALMITPDDANDLPHVSREIRCQVGGTLTYVADYDHATYTITVMDGERIPLLAHRIKATGTTATGILVYY